MGFIVTNLRRSDEGVVKSFNGRGTAKQWMKEGKNRVRWTRFSCHDLADQQIRSQLFVLGHDLRNFLRRPAVPRSVKHWSSTTLREQLVKIGAKVVTHARYVTFSDGKGSHSSATVRGYPSSHSAVWVADARAGITEPVMA